MKENRFELFRQMGWASSIGMVIVICTVMGLALGYYLDKWLNTSPWLTIACLLFGIIAGFINVYEMIKKITRNYDE